MISKLNCLLCERIHGEAKHTAVYIFGWLAVQLGNYHFNGFNRMY